MSDTLRLDQSAYTMREVCQDGQTMLCRAYEGVLYLTDPVDREHQKMNLYIPAAYYEGGSVCGRQAQTAPIFLSITVGGYMPGWALSLDDDHWMQKTAVAALLHGYVVACPAARGRGLRDINGENIGMAPAGIVDLKAAVRYLRHNKDLIPGNTERIIPNGGSAGGAMSALLGATGNYAAYEPYLERLGAAKERDDVFAASCYCPIIDLEHADAAYEWLFGGIHQYYKLEPPSGDPSQGAPMTPPEPVLTDIAPEEQLLSGQLAKQFPPYLNSLGLRNEAETLDLDEAGNGSFRDLVKRHVIASAQRALERGTDLSGLDWIVIADGRVVDLDMDRYLRHITRLKGVPAFDDLVCRNPENELFGTAQCDRRHFTAFGLEHDARAGAVMADEDQLAMMDPLRYIRTREDGTHTVAKYWRVRHGAADRDTSLAVPIIFAYLLKLKGCCVDFFLPWGQGHGSDYDLDELFGWIDQVIRQD